MTLFTFPEPADAPKLQLVHLFSAGTEQAVATHLFQDTEIPFTNCSGVHGPQISEWLTLTYLARSHSYNTLYEQQKERQWSRSSSNPDFLRVNDVVTQRLGVLGYGAIGRQIARVARGMGMTVVAYTATPKDTADKRKDRGYIVPGTGDPDGDFPSEWYSGTDKEDLHRFLGADIDWLVVSVPLTKQTRHMLSDDEFSILGRRRAFVSNIARGPIIDQPALVKALHDGRLRGAAVDVTDPEPLPKDDPLWDAPNVTITPHISGVGQAYTQRAFAVLSQNLDRKGRGENLINVVSRERDIEPDHMNVRHERQ